MRRKVLRNIIDWYQVYDLYLKVLLFSFTMSAKCQILYLKCIWIYLLKGKEISSFPISLCDSHRNIFTCQGTCDISHFPCKEAHESSIKDIVIVFGLLSHGSWLSWWLCNPCTDLPWHTSVPVPLIVITHFLTVMKTRRRRRRRRRRTRCGMKSVCIPCAEDALSHHHRHSWELQQEQEWEIRNQIMKMVSAVSIISWNALGLPQPYKILNS